MKNITFPEYWSKAKKLTQEERSKFFSSFSKEEQSQIKTSYINGGWKDLFLKNQIDEICNKIKHQYGVDLYDFKVRIIIKKEKVIINKLLWEKIIDCFSIYENCFNLNTIFGGILKKVHIQDKKMYELYRKEQ